MKRFEFGLEQVLRLKRQRQRAAELRQQQAQAVCEQARLEIASLMERLTQAAQAFAARGASVDQWLAQARYAARLEQDLKVAEAGLKRAEVVLREAAAQRTEAAREVETLIILRDSEWAEYRREAARQEQDRLDELALRQWQGARKARVHDGDTLAGEPGL